MARIINLCLFVSFLLVVSLSFLYLNDFIFQMTPLQFQGNYELTQRGFVTDDQWKPEITTNISNLTPAEIEVVTASNKEATSHPPPQAANIIIENTNICNNASHLKYMVYVHSGPENFVRRNVLRSTWLNTTFFKEGVMQYVFIMGRSKSRLTEAKIQAEAKKYGDIIQGDFMDTYRNITLKGVLGLKWVSTHCKQARLVVKVDDDAFVNIFALFRKLKMYEGNKKTIICCHYSDYIVPILRDPLTCMKWCVASDEFPSKKFYPGYCMGLAYIMSIDLVKLLYEKSRSTNFFWVDDVYITGLLPAKVEDLNTISIPKRYTLDPEEAIKELKNNRSSLTYVFVHASEPETFLSMWQLLLGLTSSNHTSGY